MTASAIIMMIIAFGTVWGGLAASILHLRNHPDDTTAHES
ncbi:methionine/alanine import family NSS transporter small subunit [Brevibacterium sp. 5221]|uniref:Methionine/alanine import family NSS transporter small subunit n=1 Tax=Brevibacterium rongguiense TaxID=2695267 RepID=A0A6N9H939_9MICO|nr:MULTISPECIES: methionine/alanine import family NSS transporter small subunit [Brevibacterium]MYM20485.1 methionine/alanine import family NSS transporter small subunit [Brevibacterium rongguiense]WAL40011.1 methionine/alanine import family NSS transporter small subunit [Brevibacterium sp. BRM-1]